MSELQPIEQDKPRIDPIEALAVLWHRRKLIAYIVGTCTVLSIIVSLILPPYYKSTATILPETEKGKLSSLGGISDLAAMAGVNFGGEGSLVRLYPTIIKSESVLRNVIYARYKSAEFRDSVNLIQYWEIEEKKPGSAFASAFEGLQKSLEVSLDTKTSVLALSLETKEPKLSADIVNKTLDELDKFILTKRTTSASAQRKFIEARLAEVKSDLSVSENVLKDFRERNRQVSNSPQLLLEQGRLERELQLNNTLFIELKKQYEIAKIEEVKNVPIINVLDLARPAVYKERPKRRMIVALTAMLSVVLGVGWVLAERYSGILVKAWIKELRARAK